MSGAVSTSPRLHAEGCHVALATWVPLGLGEQAVLQGEATVWPNPNPTPGASPAVHPWSREKPLSLPCGWCSSWPHRCHCPPLTQDAPLHQSQICSVRAQAQAGFEAQLCSDIAVWSLGCHLRLRAPRGA